MAKASLQCMHGSEQRMMEVDGSQKGKESRGWATWGWGQQPALLDGTLGRLGLEEAQPRPAWGSGGGLSLARELLGPLTSRLPSVPSDPSLRQSL